MCCCFAGGISSATLSPERKRRLLELLQKEEKGLPSFNKCWKVILILLCWDLGCPLPFCV